MRFLDKVISLAFCTLFSPWLTLCSARSASQPWAFFRVPQIRVGDRFASWVPIFKRLITHFVFLCSALFPFLGRILSLVHVPPK